MIVPQERMYHIALTKDEIEGAKYAILPGDPGRVPKIAACFEQSKQIGYNREYNVYLCNVGDEKVIVCSTGIGGPSASIAIEELYMLGVRKFIRVGTCGGMQLDVMSGDVIVVTGAIRMEGTSKEYMPIEFPAVADLDITVALRDATKQLGYPYHTGVVECKDSFYGQHDPARMPVNYELENKWNAWVKGGTKASEMESAALFTVCATLPEAKAGAIMLCVWNQERVKAGLPQSEEHDTQRAINVCVQAVKDLIAQQF